MSFFRKTAASEPKTIPPVRTAKFGAYKPLRDVLDWEQRNGTYAKRKRELPKYEMYLPELEELNVHATETD